MKGTRSNGTERRIVKMTVIMQQREEKETETKQKSDIQTTQRLDKGTQEYINPDINLTRQQKMQEENQGTKEEMAIRCKVMKQLSDK